MVRKNTSEVEKANIEENIYFSVIKDAVFTCADMVLCYAAYGSEIDVMPIAKAALESGKVVCFPRCLNDAGLMDFYRITDFSQLKSGMYGIKEPVQDCEKITTFTGRCLCLVPGLAFDINGYRLGYGKGYYDRFLRSFPGKSMGICPDILLLEQQQWEYDRYDIAVNGIATEKGVCLF